MKYIGLMVIVLLCSCADGADIGSKDKFLATCVKETLEVETKADKNKKEEIIRDCRILANRLRK